MFKSSFENKLSVKKMIGILLIIALCLFVSLCIVLTNNNSSITLHHAFHTHVVSVYYGNDKPAKNNNEFLNNKVNHYLNRITNLNKYRVSIKSSSVSKSTGDKTKTIQLKRK